MKIRILGVNNLETAQTRHTCFLIDDVLALDAGSLASSLSAREQAGIRAIALTHRHFDHVRDLPTLGLGTVDNNGHHIDVYGLSQTLESVHAHLLDGEVYPDLTKGLNDGPPRYQFHAITPETPFRVLDYDIKPIAVAHAAPAVGYIVRSLRSGSIAYTGDNGGSLSPFFADALPLDVLFVDVTFPNALEPRAKLTGHLTPGLLGSQLREALKQGVRLPKITPVHMSFRHKGELESELASLATELRIDLTPGREGALLV